MLLGEGVARNIFFELDSTVRKLMAAGMQASKREWTEIVAPRSNLVGKAAHVLQHK